MTEDNQLALSTLFERWFLGDSSASRLAMLVTEVAHVCDDLVDGDKVVSTEEVQRAFRVMLLEIPSCTFYRSNFEYLQPVLAVVWLQWTAANVMEQEKHEGDREKSYMLRAGLYSFYHAMAVLCGGLEYGEACGPEIYRSYGEKLENFDA